MQDIGAQNTQTRNKALIDLIINISNEDVTLPNKYNDIKSFIDLYSTRWRHSYSVITSYFLNQYQQPNQLNKLDLILSDLVSKISVLLDLLSDEKDSFSLQEKDYLFCRRSIEKLIDHLNLELIRKRYIEDIYKNVFNQASKSISAVKNIENKIKQFDDKVEKNTEELKKNKSESITILGIFSSIIGVLVAGVGLSSAIFANMESVTSWLLCAVTILIVLFISNTLFQLFNFLREIADRKTKSSLFLNLFNIALSLIAGYCLYMNFYYF